MRINKKLMSVAWGTCGYIGSAEKRDESNAFISGTLRQITVDTRCYLNHLYHRELSDSIEERKCNKMKYHLSRFYRRPGIKRN